MTETHDPAVVRLAELWYHAEGFLDQFQSGESLPDPKPWIERALQSEHSGDCTKQPLHQAALVLSPLPRGGRRDQRQLGVATPAELPCPGDHE